MFVGQAKHTMPRKNDVWNVIKLPGEGLTASGTVVADDFYVDDDDILSNTSSDDYTDMANPFNFGKKDVENLQTISDSFDTLTGSKECGSMRDKADGESKKMTTRDVLTRLGNLRKLQFKVWHVALLSSFVTFVVLVGCQNYLTVFDGILQHSAGASVDQKPSNKDLIYSEINFLNHDETYSPSWKPSGQYYVDFDNHIAYPLPSTELLGWEKLKTDSLILWYTAKSKYRTMLNSNAAANLKLKLQQLVISARYDVNRIRDRLKWVKQTLIERYKVKMPAFKSNVAESWFKLQRDTKTLIADLSKTSSAYTFKIKQTLNPKLQSCYFTISRHVGRNYKALQDGIATLRLQVGRRVLPKLGAFHTELLQKSRRWLGYSKKSVRAYLSRFQKAFRKKKSPMVLERFSSNLRTCEQALKKKFKCQKTSGIRFSRG